MPQKKFDPSEENCRAGKEWAADLYKQMGYNGQFQAPEITGQAGRNCNLLITFPPMGQH
jgi:hypothetical protein